MFSKKPSVRTGGGTEQPLKKERSSNLELYRIIVMLLIVAHHFVVNSGLTAADGPIFANPLAAKSLFLLLFGAWGKTGINCFVLITGYFMCKSRITIKKFLQLLLEVYFYRFVIFAIMYIAGYETLSVTRIIKLVMPIMSVSSGFTSCFLVFYLTIPFLTILVQHINEKQHRNLLLLIGIVFVGFGSIPKFSLSFSYVSWFIALYFIASYIRLYPIKIFDNTILWGWLTLASIVISAISILAMTWISTKLDQGKLSYYFLADSNNNNPFFLANLSYFFVADSNKILAVITSITSFLFFKNLEVKQSKFINTLAGSTFGVLLIHTNSDAMRTWLWKDFVNCVGAYDSKWLYLYAIVEVLAIFIVCDLIDILRTKDIEKPFFAFLAKKNILNS